MVLEDNDNGDKLRAGARGSQERRMASLYSARAFMSDAGGIGRVAPRITLRGGRSGPPESRPQLEELRSGETEPAAWGGRGDRIRPPRAVWRVLEREAY
jgi:hypothetical protein